MAPGNKKESPLSRLFSNIDNKVVESKNFPALFIRSTIRDLNISLQKWSALVNEWSMCKHSGIRNTHNDRLNHRSNLTKGIVTEEPTWQIVMKFLKVIRCVRFKAKFTLEFTWRDPLEMEFHIENLPLRAKGEVERVKKLSGDNVNEE